MKKIKTLCSLLLVPALCLSLFVGALADGEPAEEDLPEEGASVETSEEPAGETAESDPVGQDAAEEEAPPAGAAPVFIQAEEDRRVMGSPDALSSPGDNDALFAAYVERILYGTEDAPVLDGVPVHAGGRLTGAEGAVYPILRSLAEEVAAGRRTNTRFYIPYADVLDQTSWTASELGVTLSQHGTITPEAEAAVSERISCDVSILISTLLADCPYEMYWFDKTQDYWIDQDEPVLIGNSVCLTGGYTIWLRVAEGYFDSDPYTADRTYGSSVQAAAANAHGIVAEFSGKNDYDRLRAYAERISALNTYNDQAAEDESYPYGDPWQLIWVFDGDPSTNVVCEGYSKAFQYLCDLTDFRGDICCYTAWGDYQYGDSSGGHMWNIVRMDDGRNYLVDVTNCDDDADGFDDSLFLRECAFGSVLTGYGFDSGYQYYDLYYYDWDMWEAYDTEQMVICSAGYGTDDLILPEKGVPIRESYFPNSSFRQYVSLYFDWEEDGFLSPAELADVTLIDVEGKGLSSLKGLEHFPNLLFLFCADNALAALDLSGNPRLQQLDCPNNRLTALDLSGNPALQTLDCSANRLTALDLSQNSALTCLYCEDNRLKTLDISACPGLLDIVWEDDVWTSGSYTIFGWDPWTYYEYWELSLDTGVELVTESALDLNRDGIVDAADAALLLARREPWNAALALQMSVRGRKDAA